MDIPIIEKFKPKGELLPIGTEWQEIVFPSFYGTDNRLRVYTYCVTEHIPSLDMFGKATITARIEPVNIWYSKPAKMSSLVTNTGIWADYPRRRSDSGQIWNWRIVHMVGAFESGLMISKVFYNESGDIVDTFAPECVRFTAYTLEQLSMLYDEIREAWMQPVLRYDGTKISEDG